MLHVRTRAALALLTLASLVLAQEQVTVAPGGPPQAHAPAAEAPKPALPDFKEVTKDMESRPGLFTLWFYPEGAKDKDPERLLCQIPSAMLDKNFMLSSSFSGGGFFTGFPLAERVVKWELLGHQILLIEPETHFVVDAKEEVSDVVQRTYPERIRAAAALVTRSPEGDPVIDLGPLLKSDFADVAWISEFEFGVKTGINPELSRWTKKKAFPLNVEIGVALALAQASPPGSYSKKMVHFSLWALPESDYQPRAADDRVGYFLTARQDWGKPSGARDIFDRYVNRWHLVKRDPELKLCEPRKPIEFYIEKTVPVQYRRAVRDGILEWNKAYEQVGFVNAIEVHQQTDDDDNKWKDLDPEDMRYSFFRWIVTGAGFAMGPSRANPFTGQIYDADIIFDDSMVRFFEQSADQMVIEDAMAMRAQDPALRRFFEQHPEWQRPVRGWQRMAVGERVDTNALRAAMIERLGRNGQHHCDYSLGMRHQMMLAGAFLAGAPKQTREQFLYDIIKEVVMHEVGHTLGLRHNFKASSIFTVEEIQQRMLTGEATTGSVMDYNPALFMADTKLQEGHAVTPTIGPYDVWAIEYGYRPADGSYAPKSCAGAPGAAHETKHAADASQGAAAAKATDPATGAADAAKSTPEAGPAGAEHAAAPGAALGEKEMLLHIAGRAAEPHLAYASDEDATFLGPDPTVNRFDAAGDQLNWARARVKLVNERMNTILEWGVKDQESWYHLRPAFMSLMFEKAVVLDYVGRFIGGQYVNRGHRGDAAAPAPFVLVEPQKQREALAFLEETVYADDYFGLQPEVLNHLGTSRWWHEGSDIDFMVDFPIHDFIAVLQWWNLFDRVFPNTLRRIHDAELKSHVSADGSFTTAEYLQRLQKACWPGVCSLKSDATVGGTDTKPYIPDLRRSLQREYLTVLEPLVRSRPGTVVSPDLHAMATYNLEVLQADIAAVLQRGGDKLDFATKAHLRACQSRIERMLEPELTEYRS